MHVYIAKCNGCNASFPPYPIDDGAGGSVCPVFSLPCFVGIFFHSSSRLYTLPLFWSFLAQMEGGLAPEGAVIAWWSKFSAQFAQLRDRHHFLAFTCLMAQVLLQCRTNCGIILSLTDRFRVRIPG